MHVVPHMRSQSNFCTRSRSVIFPQSSVQMCSARINDVLYWVTALPACEYILMAISFCNFHSFFFFGLSYA